MKNNFGVLEKINIIILVINILHVRYELLGCHLFRVYTKTNYENKSCHSNRYLIYKYAKYFILILNIFENPDFYIRGLDSDLITINLPGVVLNFHSKHNHYYFVMVKRNIIQSEPHVDRKKLLY